MKTAKPAPAELSTSRRAQPLRQTRNNPPRNSISGGRAFGSRGSVSGGMEENPIEIFPAITHLADAMTALPKELVRHFTLLKEVDAKICLPEDDLGNLVEAALNAPLPQRPQLVEAHHNLGPTSAPMSAQGSVNGSITNGHAASVGSIPDAPNIPDSAALAWDPANIPRRQLFQHCAYTMQNMLVSLDEKNHVISTAAEALNKQLARIDECFPFIELEVSEEARFGSNNHWAYPENRVPKTAGVSRREIASANNLSAAAQHLADEAAARSDARKQALLERKRAKAQQAESDFDDHHDNRHKEKKAHGNTKVRKPAETPTVGLGITNGAATNGNAPKRRKIEKGPVGGAVMERSLSSAMGTNSAMKAKAASPRETPVPEPAKKRARAAATTNGQTRKRNGTITSAMSPSLASSPIRATFPELKAASKPSPPPTNGGRPPSIRARQNSTQSTVEKRAPSEVSVRQNGNKAASPDVPVPVATGRIVPEVKAVAKETASKPAEPIAENKPQEETQAMDGVVVSNRKEEVPKKEEPETNGDPMQGIQPTPITTTKSGRASKPSTPAMPSFPEPVRSRSQRNTIEAAANNKRSHKKGAGAAAQLIAQKNSEVDETTSNGPEDDEEGDIGDDEPTYCYCNGVSYGEMVGCDADGCEREWFHLECVGLKVAPKGNSKWYCDDCKEKLKTKRFNGR